MAPKPSARDIAAYSDAELDRYLEENGRYVTIQRGEYIPDELIQRLRTRAHHDQVAARLLEVSTDKEPLSRSSSPASTASYNSEAHYQYYLQRETEAYSALVADGGRPSHPLSLLEDIVNDPGEYREILSFWQSLKQHIIDLRDNEWKVFSIQLGRWESFRQLQQYARGLHVKEWEENRRRAREHNFDDEQLVFVFRQYRTWEDFVGRPTTRVEDRFPIYVKMLKDRLTKHGFTRTFELDEDPARQDKLTTWIEYLGYEYWWYDQYATTKRQQQWYANTWKKLVDSKVLRPFETEEFIGGYGSGLQLGIQAASEEEKAEKAVESAKSLVMLARKAITGPGRSKYSPRERQLMLAVAQSKLDMAIKEHESIKRRNDLITKFRQQTGNYIIARRDAEHHSILLRWMLQQVPLIELELNPHNVAEKDSDWVNGRRRTLKHGRAGELEEQHSKEQGRDDKENHSISERRTSTVSTPQVERHKRRSHDTVNDEPLSKRPRYNGQKPGHSNSKVSESGDTKASTEGSKDSRAAVVKGVREERKLARNKKARLANKGQQDVKASNSSGMGTSLRRSKKASSNVPQRSSAFEGHQTSPQR